MNYGTTAPRSTDKPHCECCGREIDPFSSNDGYTSCCNELVCYGASRVGGSEDRYGVPGDYVRACCWARAEVKFAEAGRPVPEGSYRLSYDE